MTVLEVVDILRNRFAENGNGNSARIPYIKPNREPFEATLRDEGIEVSILGNQPILPWAVFQEAVCVLLRNGGSADKGNAMNYRLGDDELSFDSIEGHIAHVVYGKQRGDAVFKRITPVACILIWAGICENEPRRLRLV